VPHRLGGLVNRRIHLAIGDILGPRGGSVNAIQKSPVRGLAL
jgi:hypothetical protein